VPDILYHYCSTETFHKIIAGTGRGSSFRLSSMTQSNDSMEGRVLLKTVKLLAEHDELSAAATQRVLELVEFYEQNLDGLALCLSKEPDRLSQWRGYADDGQGVAIGFSVRFLQRLVSSRTDDTYRHYLGPVRYSPADHIALVKPLYDELVVQSRLEGHGVPLLGAATVALAGSENIRSRERHDLVSECMFLLKTDAFIEEQEWRLYANIMTGPPDPDIRYQARKNGLVQFEEIPLIRTDHPIASVWLGPKHVTPVKVMAQFLAANLGSQELPYISVLKSRVSYR